MKTVVVLIAMEAELRHLRDQSETAPVHQGPDVAARDAWALNIAGHQVFAVRTGIGMLNAAASTEWAIREFQPDVLLNYGCAGAHRRDIMPGDVVIGAQTVNTGALNILRDGSEAHNDRGYEVAGERIFPAVIDADPELLGIAVGVSASHPIEDWPKGVMWPPSIPWRPSLYHIGPVASSEVWTQNLDRLDVLHQRHGSLSEDNESSACAHVALVHGIPYLAIRDIANNEYHAASDLAEFSDFPTVEVGKRAAALTAAVISGLS